MKTTNLLISLTDYGMLYHSFHTLCGIRSALENSNQLLEGPELERSLIVIIDNVIGVSSEIDEVLQNIDFINGKEVDSHVPSSNSTQLRDCPDGEDFPF